jgi:hypothetical protein
MAHVPTSLIVIVVESVKRLWMLKRKEKREWSKEEVD